MLPRLSRGRDRSSAPTLVIHGDADPLVPVEGGHDTARCVPGAELLVIEGMGHDLHPQVWPRIVEAVSEHTGKTDSGCGLRPHPACGMSRDA